MSAKTGTYHENIGHGLTGQVMYTKLLYDFSVDTGESDDTYDLATFVDNILILRAVVHVEAAIVGSSSTITLGVNDEDADAFLSTVAEATLVLNYAIDTTAGNSLWVPDGDTVRMSIGTADLTAGKLALHLMYVNG